MKIIVPMAGIGKRMRPHTLTTPKPLIPIGGKPIVYWLLEELISMCHKKVTEIAFIIGDFGLDVEIELLEIAKSFNAKGKIYYQTEALGTAHAVSCAGDSLKDEIIVAFADTIFYADFNIDTNSDSIIWVKEVDDPSAFGVVKVDENNLISDFVEKPKEFVSNKAIIGIYYFKNGNDLKSEIDFLLENEITVKGEYQLTDALENLKRKKYKFSPGVVNTWLDCGNKDATIDTQKVVLQKHFNSNLHEEVVNLKQTKVIAPCFIHKDAQIDNCIIGPHVSVGANTVIKNSIVSNSIIFENSSIVNGLLTNSIIGNNVNLSYKSNELSIGDFNSLAE